MTIEKLLIRADSRETRSGVTQLLQKSALLRVEFEELPIGDFVLSQEVCVERKEATDFVNSILDKRIFGQVASMKASFLRPVVIIEGDVFNTRSAISKEALLGALSWLSVIEGVGTIYTRSAAETAAFLEVMCRHAQNGLGYEIPLRGSKPKNLDVLAQYSVERLPSVGPTTAKKLLQHFGSVRGVYGATAAQLQAVKGVGSKMGEQITQLLDHAFK